MPAPGVLRHSETARLISPALLAWVGGVAVQLQQTDLWSSSWYAALGLLALGLSLLLWRAAARPHGVRMALAALIFFLLGWGSTGWRATAFEAHALAPELEGRDLLVTGVVSAMPQRHEAGLRFRLSLEQAQLDAQMVTLPPQLLLSWYGGVAAADDAPWELLRAAPVLWPGERWQLRVRLKAPHGHSNPHGFDTELWLWEQGVQAVGYVRSGAHDPLPSRLGQTGDYAVERMRQQVRDALFARFDGAQPQDSARWAGVLAALVVGDQQAIERADWDLFRATGVAHLMSISGLHVTLFAWFASGVLSWLWRRQPRLCLWRPAQQVGLVGGVCLAAAYAVFSGWGVPAQRTVWMLMTVSLLRLSGRRWPWPQVWLLAAAVVVAIDPWALLQAGFWLSFVAVGVLFAGASAAEVDRRRGWRARLGALWREQWIITVALTPLTLLLFGQVSLVSLASNLLAIPWVTLVVTPLSLLGVLWAPLWDAGAAAVQLLAWYLTQLAALPFAVLTLPQAPWWLGLAGMLGAFLLVLRLPPRLRLSGLLLMLPLLLWQPPRPEAGQFELLAPDIGQGNAVLVRTARHALLYDAGPRYASDSDAGQRLLVPWLRALGVRLDLLLLSHRDNDHTGGAAAVLAQQVDAEVMGSLEAGHELQALRPVRPCLAGQRWHWDGVHFEVLHPRQADYAKARRPNALSCVLRISNGAQSALLVGDIERAQEMRLLADGAALQADWLLVPHHGSKTSSSEPFLDAVAPSVALVQAGYRNRFGHPAGAVLSRYEARGIRVFDSAHCGALRWQSVQPRSVQCHREQARHYWNHRLP